MPHVQYFKLSDPTVYMIALTSFEISFLSFERCFIKTKQLHLVILLLKITQVKNLAKCHLKTRCHCIPFKFELLQFKTTLTGRVLLIATPCYVELQLLFHQSQILCSRSKFDPIYECYLLKPATGTWYICLYQVKVSKTV